jgi:transglutaminase-like putative cysteine protease
MSVLSRAPAEAALTAPIYGYGSYHRRNRESASLARPGRRGFVLFYGHEWLRMALTFATLGIAVYSLQRAKWMATQPPLLLLLAAAIFATAVLLRLKLPRGLRAGSVVGLGVVVALWQSARLTGGQSLPAALAASPNEATIHFAVFMIVMTWAVGAVSVWYVLRRGNAWIPAGLGAAIVLINLSNLPPEHNSVLPVYLLTAMAFVGLNRLIGQRLRFLEGGGRYPHGAAAWFIAAVIGISGIAVIGASVVPAARIDHVGFDLSGEFIQSLQKNWFNVFASVPGKWSITRSEDIQTLSFGAPLDNRDTVLFVVNSSQPAYWRINRYDTYSAAGWTSAPAAGGEVLRPATGTAAPGPAGTRPFSYTVETRSKTDVMLVTGEFLSTSIPVVLVAQNPGAAAALSERDLTAVLTPQLMQPYQRYTTAVSISSATPAQLARASAAYPSWVTGRYLQLPPSLSPRIRQLARTVTQGVPDVYGQAVAVQNYLRGLTYNRDAKSPSRRGEETETFLFVQKEGVCTDFASAMVVMLRTLGVPARLATGYLSGPQEEAANAYLVRGKYYHAWPEVFFPGYGWIEFEPTPRPEVNLDFTPGLPTSSTPTELPPEEIFFPDGGAIPDGAGAVPPGPARNPLLQYIVLGLLLASLGGLAWTFGRRLYQNLRMSASASGVYAKMCRLASMIGAGPDLAETPWEYSQRLAASFPEASDSIGNIIEIYSEASFSPRKELGAEQMERLKASWVRLYPILFKRRLPWNR